MLASVARAVDRLVSRGRGLDASGDPFAPPLPAGEVARLLDVVRRAPAAPSTCFPSPLPPPGGDPVVEVRLVGKGPRWALLAPHYGSLSHPKRLGVTSGLVRALRHAGWSVALVALPYHASRRVPGRPSGWGFVRADLAATQRAVLSSAAEVVAVARRLCDVEGAERLAGVGASLGGAGVGLAAAHGAPFDALAFLAAVDNPAAFYATGANRAARRATLAAAGYGAAETVAAFASVAPSAYAAPSVSPRVFAIPPEDGVVPAAAQVAWCDAWKGTRLDLRGHGHATALASARVARRVVAALSAG